MTDTLFDLDAGAWVPPAEPPPKLSADRRRTIRQADTLAHGRHPIGGAKLHAEAAQADDRDAPGRRCGNCWHRVLTGHHSKAFPKCFRSDGVYVSHSVASDVRAWWPGCEHHTYGDQTLSPDAARCVP